MGNNIYSYADCAELFVNVKNPVLGKPLRVGGIRLFKDRDQSFRLTLEDYTFAVITPDDIVTFPMSAEKLQNTIAHRLTYILSRILPLRIDRVGLGRYRIGAIGHYKEVKHLPEYFEGIRFSLTDSVCLNRRPDRKDRVNPEARKVWLKVLKEHREGALSRLKLGVRGDRTAGGKQYPTTEDVYGWLLRKEYPDLLFDRIEARVWSHNASYAEYAKAYKNLISSFSPALRVKFGVIDD